jgi:ADP-ribose pyrophosphatase YjhB (NUDIX family)
MTPPVKPRHTRYQGAIIRDHAILLIQHRFHGNGHSYWLVPGGGLEPGESEVECVRREMREETGLEVAVERLLLEELAHRNDRTYEVYKTYLCRPVSGEARPGYEPEPDAASAYAIAAVEWFDLRDAGAWDGAVRGDSHTHKLLLKLQMALGYA